jgi:hypothetical protein
MSGYVNCIYICPKDWCFFIIININKILDFSPFKNGVDLQKDSGKSPFLEFEENIDIFTLILLRLMRES